MRAEPRGRAERGAAARDERRRGGCAFACQSGAGRFGMSQEEAQEELGRLQRDKGFVKRYLDGDSDSVRRFTQLHAVAYPVGNVSTGFTQ